LNGDGCDGGGDDDSFGGTFHGSEILKKGEFVLAFGCLSQSQANREQKRYRKKSRFHAESEWNLDLRFEM
jgi:hypothetical protein